MNAGEPDLAERNAMIWRGVEVALEVTVGPSRKVTVPEEYLQHLPTERRCDGPERHGWHEWRTDEGRHLCFGGWPKAGT